MVIDLKRGGDGIDYFKFISEVTKSYAKQLYEKNLKKGDGIYGF